MIDVNVVSEQPSPQFEARDQPLPARLYPTRTRLRTVRRLPILSAAVIVTT